MCGATICFLAHFFKFEKHECEYVRQSAVHLGRTLIRHKTSFFLTALFLLRQHEVNINKNPKKCKRLRKKCGTIRAMIFTQIKRE